MKLGVFDSGIGGQAIANSLRVSFPDAEFMVVNDHENVPYGSKTPEQITTQTNIAIQPLLAAACDIIILACNSASAAAIDELRKRYPTQPFIGLEPMVKPAAERTRTGTIAVCATPATLASDRYHRLVNKYGQGIHIIEPDCREWATMIENNRINRIVIEGAINSCCEQGADVIVLACTHYHWIKDLVTEIAAGRAEVIEPSEAIGRRIKQILNAYPVSGTS
jgi:glutamate racemase